MNVPENSRRLVIGIMLVGIISVSLSGCFGGGGQTQTTYKVSGQVTLSGNPLEGVSDVKLAFSDGYGTANTDANGKWVKDGLKGTITITPAKEGWIFEPPNQSVTGKANNVDFVGAPPSL
jgi:hypothetical protein